MKVWVIRHGESEKNKAGQWTGWYDAALTEKGKQDATLAREYLSKVQFDKIYASDLQRARNTAEIAIPGCEYETDAALREVNVGSLAGKPLGIVRDENNQPGNVDGYAVFGGENYSEFDMRVSGFMKRLESLDCENVALFAHGGWLRSSMDFVVGMKLPRKTIFCKNCAIAIYEYDGAEWKLHSWINM